MIDVDLQHPARDPDPRPPGGGREPQDVKLSPDGRTLYTADQLAGGLWEISPDTFRVVGFLHTGAGAHGLYPSRNARFMYVSNRYAGTISRRQLSHSPRRRHLAAARCRPAPTWAASRPTGAPCGSAGATTPSSTPSTPDRAPPGRDPGRRGAPRPVRVAPAGPVLARSHRDHALTGSTEALAPNSRIGAESRQDPFPLAGIGDQLTYRRRNSKTPLPPGAPAPDPSSIARRFRITAPASTAANSPRRPATPPKPPKTANGPGPRRPGPAENDDVTRRTTRRPAPRCSRGSRRPRSPAAARSPRRR